MDFPHPELADSSIAVLSARLASGGVFEVVGCSR